MPVLSLSEPWDGHNSAEMLQASRYSTFGSSDVRGPRSAAFVTEMPNHISFRETRTRLQDIPRFLV
jgi:hypothetical protein